jgi:hypothetical protein
MSAPERAGKTVIYYLILFFTSWTRVILTFELFVEFVAEGFGHHVDAIFDDIDHMFVIDVPEGELIPFSFFVFSVFIFI